MFNLIPRREDKLPKLFYSPFKEMEDMVNRMFGDFRGEAGLEKSTGISTPSFNMFKDGNDMVIEASVPGFDKKDIKVELRDDLLTIKGEQKEETEKKEKDYYHREFSSSSFSRSVRLPEKVKPEDFKAKYKDGILEIRVPAGESETQTHSIRIE